MEWIQIHGMVLNVLWITNRFPNLGIAAIALSKIVISPFTFKQNGARYSKQMEVGVSGV